MVRVVTLIILMVLLGVQRDVVAQERFVDKNTLSNLGMHQGLHGSFVDALCKDVHGFVWVATQGGGLARYDGYSFRTLDVQTSQIKSNFVKEVVPDLLGRVWVFTDMGVDVVDALSMQVVTSEFFGEEEREELSIPVLFAKLSSDGSTLWYASLDTLYAVRFVDSQDSEDMQEVLSIPMERNVTALGILDNKLCVALGAQMYQANIVGEDIKLDKITLPQEVVVDITSIYQDNNELWLGTVNGLFRLSKTSTKIYVSVFDNPTTLSQNMITSIVKTASGVMVISTLRGINVYNPNTDTFERVFSQPDEGDDERHFLSSDFINCMMVNGDEIWLGTEICGVDVISPIDLSVKNYTSKEHQGALPPYPVNVITEDNTGTLWVGVIEGGLNRKRLSSSKFETYTKSNHGLPHNAVSALAFDGSNHLWVGTWGGGVCELDINQVNAPVISYWGAGSYVGVLQYDPINDGVWVGTVTNIRFVKDGNTYAPFAGDATLESIDGTLGAMIDRDKKLWLGTSEGLIIADLTTLKEDKIEYQFIDHKLDDANSKLKPRVNYIMQATDGAIYIGTNGYGLTKVTDKGGEYQFKAYTTADGLCNNSVRGILEDKDGRLWLSTNFGLSVFDAKSESFVNYTKEQGLLSDSYYWNAAYKSSRDGSLYFGTPIGLTQIKQAKITRTEEKRVHAPIVTEVIVGGENLMAKESSWKNLSVHENSKSVEIFFSALQYVNTDAVRYQYKLEGFDDKWRMPQENNSALYTNLSPGDYVLRIRCTNGKSDWSTETRLEINVEPSFYKTWWFTIIVVLIVVFIIQLIYTIRTKALSAQKRMLNLMVEKRTSELANQNIILADQNNQIRQQNEQLQEMSNRIEKLSQDKLQFFTNISHELRTPITLIMGPIQKALKLSTNPQVIEQLNYCDRNSRYLLQLVNQLMDFRKVESGEVELNPKSTRIVPFMQDLVTPFTVYASDRGITLNSHIHTSHEVVKFDNDAMSKMLTNLLGNAVKYTHEGGVINFYLATIDKKLYISVEDNGDGIPEGEIEKVFDRFYQAENHKQYPIYGQSGTGIGLYVCKCLVDAQEGSIKAINNHRGGCTMRLVLPLEVALDVIDEEVDAIEQEEEEIQVVDTKKTILVVEDNKDMRKYIRSIVEEHYNVVEAGDGLDGLAQLTKASVDFIICDLMMPVMDGLEFINKVKHNFAYSHIPILVLTAQLSDEYRTKSYQIGVESYLQKPFDEEMLLARIKGILDSRRTDQDKFINTLDPNDLNIVQESDTDKFVRRALELIRNNYSEADYLIDNLARDLGCSKSMLNKKMQDVLGYTPGTILRTYRLNVAKKMLLACKDKKYLNVAQVAYEVGFNDPKYFTRCFTKFYGCTPTLFYEQGHEEAQQKERDTTDNLDEDIERLFNAVNNDNN